MNSAECLLESIVGKGPTASFAPALVRAIAWARVSTDGQGERGQSMEEQLRQIRAFADRGGIEIVEEFSEIASAFQNDEKRVEFHRMLGRARSSPQVNAILVHDLSRFGRTGFHSQTLVRQLREDGIRVISVSDPAFDYESSSGAWIEAISFAKNEAFSRDVSFHTRKGCRANIQARHQGTGQSYTNGGQALWGYRIRKLDMGADRKGAQMFKSIWTLDDAIVADRPIHEWVHHVLVEMAGQGASLNEMRDFCEAQGLPPRRKDHWGTSTINAILQPYLLAKYTGLGIWNVHDKRGKLRPQSEWVIVEGAHPAILTAEEATRIVEVRRQQTRPTYFPPAGRSRSSPYLLSGGVFKCGRCSANMTGLKNSAGTYYVCGSLPYRRGKGCGPGVYVPKQLVEGETIRGLRELVGHTSDRQGFAKLVNEELASLWAAQKGQDPEAGKKLAAINSKIARVHHAIEEGLEDAAWANERLKELNLERANLQVQIDSAPGGPRVQNANSFCPKVSVEQAMAMRRDVEKLFAVEGSIVEKKQLLRIWVQEMKLAPERREVVLTYRVPEPMMIKMVAGAGFEPATFGL
jgi:DNA invertase Pin-like site-specific DNA recombinase